MSLLELRKIDFELRTFVRFLFAGIKDHKKYSLIWDFSLLWPSSPDHEKFTLHQRTAQYGNMCVEKDSCILA